METQENETKIVYSNMVELTEEMKQMPIEKLADKGMHEKSIEVLTKIGIQTLGQLLATDTDFIHEATLRVPYEARYSSIRKVIMGMGLFFNDDHLRWENAGISDEIAMIPINNLDLSPHVKTTIAKNTCITYFGDLLTTDYEVILHMRNFGEGPLVELKNYIHSLGFSLPNEEITMREIKDSFKAKGIPMVGDTLELDTRTSALLYRNGIYTIDDLVKCGLDVYEIIGMGDVKRKKLATALQAKNIQLGAPVVLPTGTPVAIRPTEENINKIREENLSISKRIDNKEKLLSEYDKLVAERNNLILREQKLDEEIAARVALLSSQQNEEGSNYGRK